MVGAIALFLPLAGIVVDRVGSSRVALIGLIYMGAVAYPALWMMDGHGILVAAAAFFALGMGVVPIQAAAAPLFPSLFESSVRFSGVALGFNLSTILTGGTAAYIATWLIDLTGDKLSPAYFLGGACAVGLITLTTLRGLGYPDIVEAAPQTNTERELL